MVGPFDKEEFTDSLKGFELRKAFPDLAANPHHLRVDPFEPNRVWWSVKVRARDRARAHARVRICSAHSRLRARLPPALQYIGTNTGPLLGRPATMKSVESPIQAQSITFNEKGEITKFTIGYVLDKETGNTGGLGGVFGLFYACGVGLPFPEAQPWQPSPIYGSLMSVNKAIQGVFKANPTVKKNTFDVLTTIGKAFKGE